MNSALAPTRPTARAALAALCLALAACGGGGDPPEPAPSASLAAPTGEAASPARERAATTPADGGTPDPAFERAGADDTRPAAATLRMSEAAAFRLLQQASFGPTPATLQRARELGRQGWISEQFQAPWTPLARTVEARWQARLKTDPTLRPDRRDILDAWWKEALASDAQLRWRVAYALSQIFVVSLDTQRSFGDALGYADYYDTLARHAFGNYRQLLEAVALHPAMGRYLSHLGNQKADDRTGRVPDENFAREVMQLFSIGLVELEADGRARLDAHGQPIPTYGPDDVAALARVFTGWSWDCRDGLTRRCFNLKSPPDIRAGMRRMAAYPEFHSTEEKRFLGTAVAPQAAADPQASLRAALDTLAAHPNVGPFVGRQLIQRLVTSNPSPAYVAAVAAAFADNGRGVRGDLRAVVRAVLTHPEARQASGDGKVREPVLRLASFARAFGVRSSSGEYRVPYVEAPTLSIGQQPFRAPSVFNFYRPGYTPPAGRVAEAGLVAPELQIADDTSVAAYVRAMRSAIEGGFGAPDAATQRRDMQFDFAAEHALAHDAPALVRHVFARLLPGGAAPPAHAALAREVTAAVETIALPALNKAGTNQGAIDRARRDRVRAALLLTVAAPEYIVQK